jgi:hypothetical protein
MCVRAVRITVLKSAGNFTRDECHDLNAEKIQPVKCFMFTRCGICCVPAIFERRRGRLGSKISTYGQLTEVAAYFAMSGLPPQADTNRKGRHVRWVPNSGSDVLYSVSDTVLHCKVRVAHILKAIDCPHSHERIRGHATLNLALQSSRSTPDPLSPPGLP